MVRFGVPNQSDERERRVALTPTATGLLIERGHRIQIEHGAGEAAGYPADQFRAAGAAVVDRDEVFGAEGVILAVTRPATEPPAPPLGPDHTLIGVLDPLWRADEMAKLAPTGATVFALDLMPRTTRAQSMDVLSSMATVAGYEAALLAASRSPRMLPLMMTAGGTVPAAKVVVLGAGVAGLQAIATARRLGAIVEAYDIRPAATEQIRSLGAKAIEADIGSETEDAGGYATKQAEDVAAAQHALLGPYVEQADVVITTAAIPGATSPELITAAMVDAMAPGSVIVDIAAERGGNCALTEADREVERGGVLVLGPTDLASRSAETASRLFAGNLLTFIEHLLSDDGDLVIDRDDEIVSGTLVALGGEVVNAAVSSRLGQIGEAQ